MNYEENSETQLLSIIPSHNSIKLQRTFLLAPELDNRYQVMLFHVLKWKIASISIFIEAFNRAYFAVSIIYLRIQIMFL